MYSHRRPPQVLKGIRGGERWWLAEGLAHVDARCARCDKGARWGCGPRRCRPRGGFKIFLSCVTIGQEREEVPGLPGWDGAWSGCVMRARAPGRTRRLGSLTSTFTACEMEDIVRERHLHREILAHASALELKCQFDRVARRAASLSTGKSKLRMLDARQIIPGYRTPGSARNLRFVLCHLKEESGGSAVKRLVRSWATLHGRDSQERSSMTRDMVCWG